MRVFIDTNILVDLICKREKFIENAKKIFLYAYDQKITLAISALSYINTLYIAKRYDFKQEEIIKALQIISQFSIITGFDEDTIKLALASDWKDMEDAVQYYSALTTGIDYIVTRNQKDFQNSNIPIVSPDEIIKLIEAKTN